MTSHLGHARVIDPARDDDHWAHGVEGERVHEGNSLVPDVVTQLGVDELDAVSRCELDVDVLLEWHPRREALGLVDREIRRRIDVTPELHLQNIALPRVVVAGTET